MCESLRAEFPEIAAIIRRIPRVRVTRTTPPWALLAALGAGLIGGAVARTLASFAYESPWPADVRPFEVAHFVAGLVTAGVAVVAGGRSGVVLLFCYKLVGASVSLIRLELYRPTCPTPVVCPDWLALAGSGLPFATGVVVGLAVAGRPVRGRQGTNALLEGAGAFALTSWLASLLELLIIPSPVRFNDEMPYLPMLVLAVVGAGPAAVVFARRAARPLRAALVFAAVLVLTWVYPFGLSQLRLGTEAGQSPIALLLIADPAVTAVLCLALTAALAARRDRPLSGASAPPAR